MLALAYSATGDRVGMRKRVAIEKLLSWTYREELPKGFDTGNRFLGPQSPLCNLAQYGTSITAGNQGEPGFFGAGDPHPDALKIDYRVRALSDVTMLWEHLASDIMGDLLPFAPINDPILRRMQFSPSALIQLHARMGTIPQWHLGEVKVRPMRGGNSRPVVLGITAGGRYAEGSHCPLVLEIGNQRELTGDGIAREIACARAEYYVWRSALVALAAERWKLEDHTPLPPAVPARPWTLSPSQRPRILRDISNSSRALRGAA